MFAKNSLIKLQEINNTMRFGNFTNMRKSDKN